MCMMCKVFSCSYIARWFDFKKYFVNIKNRKRENWKYSLFLCCADKNYFHEQGFSSKNKFSLMAVSQEDSPSEWCLYFANLSLHILHMKAQALKICIFSQTVPPDWDFPISIYLVPWRSKPFYPHRCYRCILKY